MKDCTERYQSENLYLGETLVVVEGLARKAMSDQMMAINKLRLKSQLGAVSKADMRTIESAILLQLGMPR